MTSNRSGVDDAERLRSDDSDIGDAIDQDRSDGIPGSSAVAVRTVSGGSYPTSANRFYKCEIYRITGTQTENSSGTETATGKYIFAWNHGSSVPAVGTRLIAIWAPYRWQVSYNA